MIRRRAKAAGIHTKIGHHTFRATGITAYLRNGGRLEVAQQIRRMSRHRRPASTAGAGTMSASRNGQYGFLSSGDVVDVKTKKIVAQMKDEYGKPMHSEKLLEMSFSNGKLTRTVSQFGEGIPSAVQASLAGRALSANAK